MSLKVTEWVAQYSQSRGNDRLVLLGIATRADDAGLDAHPSIVALATFANVHPRTVIDCLYNLGLLGELTVEARHGRHGCNRYRIHMDALPLAIAYRRKRRRGRPNSVILRGGDVTTSKVVTSPSREVVTSPPCTSGTSVRPKKNNRAAHDIENNGARPPCALAPVIAAARKAQNRDVLRRVAWAILEEQNTEPSREIIKAGTVTGFAEALTDRLEALKIPASPEQIARAAVAMWNADIRARLPEVYRDMRELRHES